MNDYLKGEEEEKTKKRKKMRRRIEIHGFSFYSGRG